METAPQNIVGECTADNLLTFLEAPLYVHCTRNSETNYPTRGGTIDYGHTVQLTSPA